MRWQPDAAQRLTAAALDLFLEQGYDGTTVAQIAERAGLTTRSFFNHFVDKREVLFGAPSTAQQQTIERSIAVAPEDSVPFEVAVAAMQVAAAEVFEPIREGSVRRRRVIEATPELQDRQASKRRAQVGYITGALLLRGAAPSTAALAAQLAVLVLENAESAWAEPNQTATLSSLVADAAGRLRDAASGAVL